MSKYNILFQENKENFLNNVKPLNFVYHDLENLLTILQNQHKNLKSSKEATKMQLIQKFNSMIETLKTDFNFAIENYTLKCQSEIINLETLILYFKNEIFILKEKEIKIRNQQEEFKNLKLDLELFLGKKNGLIDIMKLNSRTLEQNFENLKYFLRTTNKKTEEFSDLTLSIDKELNLFSNLSSLMKEKILDLSSKGNNLSSTILEIRNFSSIFEDLSTNPNKMRYSDKNFSSFQKKREILTSHQHKEHKEMFNPSDISLTKIIHFKDNYYMTGGWDGSICIVNILGKKILLSFEAHSKPIRDIIKLQNNVYITTSEDHTIKIWNIETEENLLFTINVDKDKIRALIIINGGFIDGNLICGGDEGYLKSYEMGEFKNEFSIKCTDYGITSLLKLQKNIIIGTAKGEIVLFDYENQKISKKSNNSHNDWITCLTALSDIDFVSGSYDLYIKLWILKENNDIIMVRQIKLDGWISKILVFQKNIINVAIGKNLSFIDIEKGTILKKISDIFENNINDMLLSQKDGTILLVGQDEKGLIKEYSD